MKLISIFLIVMIVACNANEQQSAENSNSTADTLKNTVNDSISRSNSRREEIIKEKEPESDTVIKTPVKETPRKIYSNERFKDVTVNKIGENKFLIRGKGQIFEASFGWVVEDGHDELKKGFEMTDAGAPEWGHFSFTVDVKKKRPNSTLHLVLFETSAKDGSRQYELPIFLY